MPGRIGKVLAGSNYWHDVTFLPKLSTKAENLLRDALNGVPYIVDAHMHLVGTQTDKTGCHVHLLEYEGFKDTMHWVKQQTLSAAAGIKGPDTADDEVTARTAALVQHFPYGVPYYSALLAFSPTYELESGEVNMSKTSLLVPNEYMLKVTAASKANFIPAGSVHPYDKDAIEKLRELKRQGVHLIKWLPNSMHIEPSHKKSLAFLSEMAKLKMVLITHVGDEHAVNATGVNNDYGNPELYRGALEKDPDLRIIFAHVGSEGSSLVDGKWRENFDLVIGLLKDFPKQAFADISAFSSAIKRVRYLPKLLSEKSIHGQLLYGTDYPLAAVGGLVYWSAKLMWAKGLLSLEQTRLIHEIFRHNPLAAAFVTMRTLNYQGKKLPTEVFYKNINKVFHEGHMPFQLVGSH